MDPADHLTQEEVAAAYRKAGWGEQTEATDM